MKKAVAQPFQMASDAPCANAYSRTTCSGFLSVRNPRKTGYRIFHQYRFNRMMMQMLGSLAEFEREMMHEERTKE
jgi:hypothetical protein